MSPFISSKIAHFSAYFASSGPANTQLSGMTEKQKIALAQKIRDGQADAIFKVTHGPVSEEEVTARKNFFANPDVQRKLVKGWIHGTMTEPAIIDAMKKTGVVLTSEACDKIWYAKSALMLDTFRNRPETLSILPLLKNLSADSILQVNTYQNARKITDSSSNVEQAVVKSKESPRVRFAEVVPATLIAPTVNVFAEPVKIQNTGIPSVKSATSFTGLGMVALQLFAYASNQNNFVGTEGALMIASTFSLPSLVSVFPLEDFTYGPGVKLFNEESNFHYISFDQFEMDDEGIDTDVGANIDVPKPAIDVLEYQYASYTTFLNFDADNLPKPASYTSFSDYGWNTTVTDMNDAADYDDMPALVPLNQSEIE